MAEKTSIWIDRLSKEGKDAMHAFLLFFNTEKMQENKITLNDSDTKTLSVIIGRLTLQNSKEKLNQAIEAFNKSKKTKIKLIE